MNSRKLSKGFHESQKSMNRFRWFMVLLLLFGAIINYFDRTNISIANVVIADEFGLGEAKMGVLLSAFAWPYAIVSLLSGWAVDKKRTKKNIDLGNYFLVTCYCN
ncbi:MFS transporter [Staphylococcus ureilyticus]